MARARWGLLLGGSLAVWVCVSACSPGPGGWRIESCATRGIGRETHGEGPNVILITIDGVRRRDLFERGEPSLLPEAGHGVFAAREPRELLPHLYRRMIDGGVALGAPGRGPAMIASGPRYVSFPGYIELLSGRPSRECREDDCPPNQRSTILDELLAHDRLRTGEVAVVASWESIETITARAADHLPLSAGRNGGRTRDRLRVDRCASRLLDAATVGGAMPGHRDYRPDRYTASLALRYLLVRRPRFLYIALGDTDEWAHRGDYVGYTNALASIDRFVGDLFARLDRMGRYGRETTVLITTDHGRSRDFIGHGSDEDSSRVWLLAAGRGIPSRGVVDATREWRLADVAPTIRALLELPPDEDPEAGRVIVDVLRR